MTAAVVTQALTKRFDRFTAVDGGDGSASVRLPAAQRRVVVAMAERTASDPDVNPVTGLELGKSEDTMPRTPKLRLDLEQDDVPAPAPAKKRPAAKKKPARGR